MIYFISNQENFFDDPDIRKGTMDMCLEWCRNREIIELDTETEGFDPYTKSLICIQVGDKDTQFVIDINSDWKRLIPVLEDPNKLFLGANLKFDLKFFYHQRVIIKRIHDCMIAEAVLTTGLNREDKGLGLAAMAKKYCGVQLNKDVRKNFKLDRTGILYAASDVAYLSTIREKQMVEVKKLNLEKTLDLENKFVRVLAKVEYDGFKIDVNKWNQNTLNNKRILKEKEAALNQWILDNVQNFPALSKFISRQLDLFSTETKIGILWSSSKQVIKVFNTLGVDTKVPDKTSGKMKDSVEATHIKKFKDNCSLVAPYIEYKEYQKLVSTYGDSFVRKINSVSGRIHTNFWQILETGRTSSGGKDKSTGEDYINFQNIPSDDEIRSCFIAEKGHLLIVNDYSQQEPRITADKCQDDSLVDLFLNGDGDTHTLVTNKMFTVIEGKPVSITKKDPRRQIGKVLNLKLDYGGSAYTVKDDLKVSESEAQVFIDALKAAFPRKEEYFKWVINQTLQNGYITIDPVTNRKSFISFFKEFREYEKKVRAPGFWELYREKKETDEALRFIVRSYFKLKGKIERNSKNYPIQGTAASMTKLAGIRFLRMIEEKGWFWSVKIPNTIHDEWVVESPEGIALEVAKLLEKAMVDAGRMFCKTIPMIADPEITPFWKKG